MLGVVRSPASSRRFSATADRRWWPTSRRSASCGHPCAGQRGGRSPTRSLHPMRVLAATLAAIAIVACRRARQRRRWCRADDYVVSRTSACRPTACARYQYNPRVLDLVRARFRAARVFDRGGLPLATGDPAMARRARGRTTRSLASLPTCILRRADRALLSARRRGLPPARRCADPRRTGAQATRRTSSATPRPACAASTITPRLSGRWMPPADPRR